MTPKNPSYEELCDNRSLEILSLRLKLQTIMIKQRRQREQLDFLRALSMRFFNKISQVRRRDRLASDYLSEEIKDYFYEIDRIEERINTLILDNHFFNNQREEIEDKIRSLQNEFRQFARQNGRLQN